MGHPAVVALRIRIRDESHPLLLNEPLRPFAIANIKMPFLDNVFRYVHGSFASGDLLLKHEPLAKVSKRNRYAQRLTP